MHSQKFVVRFSAVPPASRPSLGGLRQAAEPQSTLEEGNGNPLWSTLSLEKFGINLMAGHPPHLLLRMKQAKR